MGVLELELLGTVDELCGCGPETAELTSVLIRNDRECLVEGRTVFRIPLSFAKKLRIDDRLTVKITVTRDNDDAE